ncbi:MAG: hypothetical protein RIQ60_1301 [Pseudomonadota bacterium]|jgi:hypothetical protein
MTFLATPSTSTTVDANKPPGRLKVVLLSLPPRTQAVLDFFIANTGRSSFIASHADQADAAVFDHDHPDSRNHWLQYHARHGKPGIMLSIHPQEMADTVAVAKPITPAALLTAAAQVHAGWMQRPAAAYAAPVSRPAPLSASYPAPTRPAAPAQAAPAIVHAFAAAGRAMAAPVSAPVAAPVAVPAAAPVAAVAPMPVPAAQLPGAPLASVPVASTSSAVPVSTTIELTATSARAPVQAPVETVDASAAEPVRAPAITLPAADVTPAVTAATPAARTVATAGSTSTPASISRSDLANASRSRTATAGDRQQSASAAAATRAATDGGMGGRVGGFLRKLFSGDAPAAPAQARRTTPGGHATPVASAAAVASGHTATTGHETTLAAIVTAAQEEAEAAAKPVVVPAATVAAATHARPSTAAHPPHPASPAAAPSASHDGAHGKAGAQHGRKAAAAPVATAAVFPDEAMLCGNREELPSARWSSDAGLRYELADHLVGALREAWQVGSKWRVPTHFELQQGRVVVDTAQCRVHFDFDTSLLAGLWTQPLARRPKTRTLSRQENREFEALLAQPGSLLRMDQLLWRAGMITSAGRLPNGVDVTRTIYLKHWPNFTRIERFPQAVRVAALWATRGASIIETAKLVGLPQRQVIAFYNGMAALDLVTEDGSHIRRSQRKGQNRGLLTRLLGWLQH